VSDTGIGMEQEFLDKVFEKFTQEDQTVSKNYGGTGLGMTIVKELVRLMDGSMRIQSQKGAGTTITIEFPFSISEEPQIENAVPVVLPIEKLKGRKILLVEDNPTNRIVACSMMQPYGLEITEAEDGYDALEKLKNQLPELILMDIQMPGMDGIETTIQIRKRYGTTIPIIALTANVLLPMQVKCRENGMNDFLAKPYEEEDLIAKICRGLQLEMKEGIPVLPVISSSSSAPIIELPKELYNLSKLEKLSRGDTVFMKKMLGIFLNEVPQTLQRLETACNELNYAEIKASAHRLKPSVTDMGIFSIKEILAETEIAAMEQDKSIVAKHQPRISSTIQEVLVQIKEKYEAL
jgi:CheY-like chemotaxis protein